MLLPFAAKASDCEAVTERLLSYPVLDILGWHFRLPQQRTETKARERVPDLLLLANVGDRRTALVLKGPADRRRRAFKAGEVETRVAA